ncbi:MAG TPA: DNA polymerase III subunit delta [Saprospiraceae bacterium]|nr:DNA polymerase III subunit delta [Saprospiraceae bacterium]
MTVQSIINNIKNKKIEPVYILHGEEPFFIDQIADYIENNLLDEAAKAFNQIVVYGKDTDARSIIDEAKQFPMMSERRLIIVKEAQDLKSLQDIAPYVLKPVPHTVLVLCHKYKKIDKRYALGKTLDKLPLVFESKPFYDNQLPTFIAGYASEIGLQLDPLSIQMIADYLGNDLSKITNELDKLLLNIGTSKKVTTDDIQELIGISKVFNVFEYQNALGQKDIQKVLNITSYFTENPKAVPIQVAVSSLYNYFSKILIACQYNSVNDQDLAKKMGLTNAFFLKDYKNAAKNYNQNQVLKILVYLSEIDLKSKGVSNRHANDAPLFQDLAYFILNS